MTLSRTAGHLSTGAQIVLLLGANLTINAGASLTPVFPSMAAAFSDVPGAGFWMPLVMTLPALLVVVGGPVVGYLVDRLGRKPVLLMSLLFAGLGGCLGAVFDTIGLILATRILVGLGIAGALTATNSLIADYYDGPQRSQFMGRQAAAGGLLSVVFLLVGGSLSEVGWRYAFLSYLPLLLLLPLAMWAVKEPDLLVEINSTDQPKKIQVDRELGFIFSAGFLSQFSFVTVPVYIAFLLNQVLGTGGNVVGWLGAASSVFLFLAGVLYAKLSRRGNFRSIAVGNYFLFVVGFSFLGFGKSWAAIIAGELLVGFCQGLNNANLANWLSNVVDVEIRGRANGIFATLMSLGPFAAPFLFSLVISRQGYPAAFIVSGMVFMVIGVGGLFIPSTAFHSPVSEQ